MAGGKEAIPGPRPFINSRAFDNRVLAKGNICFPQRCLSEENAGKHLLHLSFSADVLFLAFLKMLLGG